MPSPSPAANVLASYNFRMHAKHYALQHRDLTQTYCILFMQTALFTKATRAVKHNNSRKSLCCC